MAVVTMKQLLEAGVHFGHQTRRWNPKMKRFIHGERNGIYIIDLNQTLQRIEDAYSYVRDLVADGGTIMFVGTKKQTQDPVAKFAMACDMPYIKERWLGGMLTNFNTMAARVQKMTEYQRMRAAGDFENMPKKEALLISRELEKLERNLGGIRNLDHLPDAVFIIDTKKEHIAVTEANKLHMPIVAVVDTNCDPDVIDYVIPGNDDAIRSGTLMCRVIAEAVREGKYIYQRKNARAGTKKEEVAALTPEQEAERAAQQDAARNQAAEAQAKREAKLAAAKAEGETPDVHTVDDIKAATDEAAGAQAEAIAEAQPGTASKVEPEPQPGQAENTAALAEYATELAQSKAGVGESTEQEDKDNG